MLFLVPIRIHLHQKNTLSCSCRSKLDTRHVKTKNPSVRNFTILPPY